MDYIVIVDSNKEEVLINLDNIVYMNKNKLVLINNNQILINEETYKKIKKEL